MSTFHSPLVCFVGPSNVGKTTLVSKVIAHLSAQGLKVGALKHASHAFQMDRPGKDTHHFRRSGAYAIGIASSTERALITTTDHPASLAELAATLPAGLDFIVVEGYKSEGAPTVEVHRGDATLMTGGDALLAVVTDGLPDAPDVPRFGHDDVPALCALLRAQAGLPPASDGATAIA